LTQLVKPADYNVNRPKRRNVLGFNFLFRMKSPVDSSNDPHKALPVAGGTGTLIDHSLESDRGLVSGARTLARRLGVFDATMIVMGGIIGSGIFMNPAVVAKRVQNPVLILGAWVIGGVIALAGAFIYSELAVLRPDVGGQYAYLRDAYHPALAFLYGWALLLVIQSGGMAAVAITFASYFKELTGIPASEMLIGALVLGLLTAVNCLGVRAGTTVQNVLMVLKIGAIAALVICGLAFAGAAHGVDHAVSTTTSSVDSSFSFTAMGAALIPVMFAYGGWQTSSFVSGELRDPQRDLPRGLMFGVAGVIVLYVAVSFVCLRALGPQGLAATQTPASAVMLVALGRKGAQFIACGIAISTLGFLSQSILTAPRVYYAMAQDKLFFKSATWLDPRWHVPTLAIVLQGALAIVIVCSGKYEPILNYVVSIDFIFFGLTAGCVFIFRRRQRQITRRVETEGLAAANSQEMESSDGSKLQKPPRPATAFRVPGHPLTTALFMAACWLVVLSTVYRFPENAGLGLAILLGGIPVYFFWRWWRRDS
jgi:basic amino acid/polyamine antiporter, APA family